MRFRLRTLFVLVGAAAAVFAVFAAFLRITEYSRYQRAGAVVVESLAGRRPANVSQKTWDDATGWAITAYHNVCFSEGHVPLPELHAFIRDVDAKFDGPVDLNTVDWIWTRLASTGRHGKQYAERFEPQYRAIVYRELIGAAPTTNGAP